MSDSDRIDLPAIEAAAARIAGGIMHTPSAHSATLSAMTGADIWLKFDQLQFTGSFKERGALNFLLGLDPAIGREGVIAASTGNHAQAVARHAQRLGYPATIFMPQATPARKRAGTATFGAEIRGVGANFQECFELAKAHAEMSGAAFVHPFDDPRIIIGQGTAGLEMAADMPALDAIIVPIGGGGLISGIATVFRALNPRTRIVGVQTEAFPSMVNRIKGTSLPIAASSIAEGIAVKTPGELTARIIADKVDELLTVKERAIEDAIASLIEVEKVVAEGAGAIGLAAVMENPGLFADQRVGLIVCGGNLDLRRMAATLLRHLRRDGRIASLSVDLSDLPGELATCLDIIAHAGGNILEIGHNRQIGDLSLTAARVEITLEADDPSHITAILTALGKAGLETRRTAGERSDR